jgi:16S rRNA (cytidine1402-2'-O)-methyltransferase
VSRREHAVVEFHVRGHAGITGSHDKTVEFTRDQDVTRRATCVLGVGSDHDDALLALRGDVEVVIDAVGHRDAFTAALTPFYIGDDSLVFRRGPALRGRTIAGDASKGAADIDRALVRVLGDATTSATVTVSELGRGDRTGALFVVAVPIGNDDDLTPRARAVLGAVDVVLAEDTRRFRDLARRVDLAVPGRVSSYRDQNEAARAGALVARLQAGARVALVSDAGTPLFSDPGYVIVRDAIDAGVPVSPVPGASSVLTVLSASGLAVERFSYVGFLTRRSAARQRELQALRERRETFVVHEAPHRIAALLADLAAVVGDWDVCVGREVTKVFEEFERGTAAELATAMADREPRGEYTLVVAPPADAVPDERGDDSRTDAFVRALLDQGVTTKTVAAALAELPGISRKEAYARVLALGADE